MNVKGIPKNSKEFKMNSQKFNESSKEFKINSKELRRFPRNQGKVRRIQDK